MRSDLTKSLCFRLSRYDTQYPGQEKKVILKLIVWLIKRFISSCGETALSVLNFSNSHALKIGLILGGGMGDVFVNLIYADKLFCMMGAKFSVDLFIDQSIDDAGTLFKDIPYIRNINKRLEIQHYLYDAVITLDIQFPEITFINYKKIQRLSIFLTKYQSNLAKFYHDNPALLLGLVNQQQYCLITKKNRLTAVDVTDQLGLNLSDRLPYELVSPDERNSVLDSQNLKSDDYITIQNGVDRNMTKGANIRGWPDEYYPQLVAQLRSAYPNFKIVQIGSASSSRPIAGVTLGLLGKLSFKESAIIASFSKLHIDLEGGFVHVRHSLSGKPSVVLFGPTSISTKGYPENLNLKAEGACNCDFCEWVIGEHWQHYCLKTAGDKAACMQKLTPDFVFKQIDAYLRQDKA